MRLGGVHPARRSFWAALIAALVALGPTGRLRAQEAPPAAPSPPSAEPAPLPAQAPTPELVPAQLEERPEQRSGEAPPAPEASPATAAPSGPGAPPLMEPGMPLPPPLVPPPGAELDADEGELEEDNQTIAIKYLLERVEVRGNTSVKKRLIRRFVPFDSGHAFAVDDPEIEAMRYRLLGTGWFDRVELHLERGQERGWVVLVIQVEERRTLVFQQLAAGVGWSVEGASGKTGGDPTKRKAEPYLGLALAETNFLGTGNTLGGTLLVSPDQQGFALTFVSPVVRASRWALRTRGAFVNGQEYFGGDADRDVRVSVQCDEGELSDEELESCEINPSTAVVDYWRASLSLGTAKDVGSFTRLTLDWNGDFVRVPPSGMPVAASELRGRGSSPESRQPIDFAIERYNSFVSMVSLGFTYDKRDSASLTSRGTVAGFTGDLASGLIGSDYDFVRVQMAVNHWKPLPWGHVLRVGAFGGAVFGYAPFFYKFFVSDLTDLHPSRILGVNLDHRPAPNLFGLIQCGRPFDSSCGTAVSQMRHEELAARIDAEYSWPIVRGRRRFLKNADLFALVGLYALADPNDLRIAIPGYEGISRLPIDLTLDVGARLDTRAGVFQIGIAKLAWLPVQ